MYRKHAGNMEERLREYAALQEMRRLAGDRHLPAGSQFDFARESFRRVRSDAPGVTDVNGCAWTSAGPTNLNGRVTDIDIDPTDNQRIYASTVGGLWRSQDAGRRWQRVSDDFLATVFGAIAVNPGQPKEIIAGGGDSNMATWYTGNGLWRSTDYGAPGSWTKVTPKFDNTVIYQILIDPKPPYDVYVAATNGVWVGKHDVNGLTFDKPLGNMGAMVHDIAVDFSANPRKIYAGVREPVVGFPFTRGIWKWKNNTWTKSDSGIDTSDPEAINIALFPGDPDILYAKVSRKTGGKLVGVYRTDVAAEGPGAWKLLTGSSALDDGNSWYNAMIEVHPKNPDIVWAGGVVLRLSTNGGTTFEPVNFGKDPEVQLEAHADNHALVFDPVDPNIVYVGNDGGIDRSTDISKPTWHWVDVSHGMIITMYYYLTGNRAHPSLLAGGTQDNGTMITMGNRTWYQPWGCDGYDVGSDAKNPSTLYANCNQNLMEIANPVPGTSDPFLTISWITMEPPRPPVITDEVVAGAALAEGGYECAIKTIVKTEDGVNWTATNTKFKPGAEVVALASAPSSSFQTYLAAVKYTILDPEQCPDFDDAPFDPYVLRTDDGGATWVKMTGLPVNQPASAVAFDPYDASKSYVTYRSYSRIYTCTGTACTKIGSAPLPNDVRTVVVDPFDTNVLYAATFLGVFRGVVTPGPAAPSAAWAPFNEGLPDGMEINDLWMDPKNGILTIGSFGFGAFRRDIRKEAECPARMLVVRDCVNDDGRELSPCGGPDMEHPILVDPAKPDGFWKPDDTIGGKAHWWKSRDIRVDVPSFAPKKNRVDDADSVEFDLCPSTVSDCPPQSIIDNSPESFLPARVYVQVANRGVEAVTGTRVIALWNKSGGVFEKLPETFWKQTFPAGGPCGALDPGTGWQLVDPDNPCRTIATVAPDMPELARFDWTPPFGVEGGAAMLTIVESELDPLDPSIREQNKLSPSDIVPSSRHIALRNVHIKRFDIDRVREPFLWPLDLLHLPEEMTDVEVVVSKPGLSESVRIVLPAGLTARAGMGSARQVRVTEAELVRKLESMRLDPDNAWELSGDEASLFVDLRPGQRVTTAVIATPADTGATSHVSIVERSRGKVVGGSTMMLRPEM
ncbi:MAG TPA: hypothetical protein VEK57_27235 [Thermoanaerobaculia bacterium]|nr:hypothetical protein [Thermoanaerobaculia bacterium]